MSRSPCTIYLSVAAEVGALDSFRFSHCRKCSKHDDSFVWVVVWCADHPDTHFLLSVLTVASFTKEVNPRLAKRKATGVQLGYHTSQLHLNSMLVNMDFLTWLLIGWRLCCQPIRCPVLKSLLTNMGLIRKFLSLAGPWSIMAPTKPPVPWRWIARINRIYAGVVL